jgi:hypothetical protein
MTNRDPRNLFNSDSGDSAVLHLRFEGRIRAIALDILDVGVASTDELIKLSVAEFLDVPANKLRNYVVERHANGNLTLRPEAVFG